MRQAGEEYDAIVSGEASYFGSILEGGATAILVMFQDGSVYRYQASSIGDGALEDMIGLSESNSGLVGFIQANVKYDYS